MSRITLTLFSGKLSQVELQAIVDEAIREMHNKHGGVVAVTQEVSNSE